MSGSFSDYLEKKILDHVLGGSDYERPSKVYVGLATATINDATTGSTVVEPTGNGYSRVEVTNNVSNWPKAVGIPPSIQNAVEIEFPKATDVWGTVSYFFIADASTEGNILVYGELENPISVGENDVIIFEKECLVVQSYEEEPEGILVAASNAPQSVKDVADYVCTGTNDHTTIQAALNFLKADEIVILSKGIFNLDGDVYCRSNTTLQGSGKLKTILQWTSGKINCDAISNFKVKRFTSKGTGRIWIFNCKDAIFENIRLETNDSGWQAAFQMWAESYIIEDIEFLYCDAIDCGSHGWHGGGGGTGKEYLNIKFIGCKAIDCGRYTRNNDWCCGFQLAENTNGENFSLENCYAEGNFEAGFMVGGSPIKKNYVIKNCIAINNGTKPLDYYNTEEGNYGPRFGAGFRIHGDMTIEDCYAASNSIAGFVCWYPNSGYISKFIRCKDENSRSGFLIDYTSYVEITNCISRNAIRHGISIVNSNNITSQSLECVTPGGFDGSCNQFGIQGYPVEDSTLDVSLRGGNYTALKCYGVNVTFTGEVLTNVSPKISVSGSVNIDELTQGDYSGEPQ